MAISHTIKKMLEVKGMTQGDLAKALGITKQNMSNKMGRNTFSPNELTIIADVLGLKLCFLDEGEAGKVVAYPVCHYDVYVGDNQELVEPVVYSIDNE